MSDREQAPIWHYVFVPVAAYLGFMQGIMDWITALVAFFVEHGIIRLFIVFSMGIAIGHAVA